MAHWPIDLSNHCSSMHHVPVFVTDFFLIVSNIWFKTVINCTLNTGILNLRNIFWNVSFQNNYCLQLVKLAKTFFWWTFCSRCEIWNKKHLCSHKQCLIDPFYSKTHTALYQIHVPEMYIYIQGTIYTWWLYCISLSLPADKYLYKNSMFMENIHLVYTRSIGISFHTNLISVKENTSQYSAHGFIGMFKMQSVNMVFDMANVSKFNCQKQIVHLSIPLCNLWRQTNCTWTLAGIAWTALEILWMCDRNFFRRFSICAKSLFSNLNFLKSFMKTRLHSGQSRRG